MKKSKLIKRRQRYKTILRVAQMAVLRGIHNVHQLAEITGISYPRTKKLWDASANLRSGEKEDSPEVKLELEDIDLLCEGLNCKVKDLIVRVPVSG